MHDATERKTARARLARSAAAIMRCSRPSPARPRPPSTSDGLRHPRRFHPVRADADRRRGVPPPHAAGRAHRAGGHRRSTSSASPASRPAPASTGFVWHMHHEWVILTNLLCLLVGFALLSNHFEKSRVPDVLPRFLPDDWKGCFVLLVMIFVLSSFLDNIAAALIGGAMAAVVFRRKVHIGYLAAIVAASNAGGSGSVVGDTTTTMMWLDGVSPLAVLDAYVAAAVALVIFGIPAAIQQQRYSPDHEGRAAPRAGRLGAPRHRRGRSSIVAIADQRDGQSQVQGAGRLLPVHRRLGVGGDPARHAAAQAAVGPRARGVQGQHLPARARDLRLADAGGEAAARVVAERVHAGLRLGGVRQHPAHRARAEAGRVTTGACSPTRWASAAR